MAATQDRFSVADVLDLPPGEREVWRALVRIGPANPEALAAYLGRDLAEVQARLIDLERKGRIRPASDEGWQGVLPKVRPQPVPHGIWSALLPTDRIYSVQEIETLRTAIPMLQFARARLSEYTDHGPGHSLRVKTFATQLGYIQDLTEAERHLLRVAALFHDIGNVVDRAEHHIHSQKTVERLCAANKLPFSKEEGELIALLCRWHRREYDPGRTDALRGEPIRTGLLAGILRVADAMDIDQRRSDYHGKFREILEFFFPDHLPHFTSAEQIAGVRIHIDPAVTLQVFARGPTAGNVQIDMLRTDLSRTPFDWTVTVTGALDSPVAESTPAGRALLVFPFEAHSLVMAALSRMHLAGAGYEVDLRCYPDAPGEPARLYREILPSVDPASCRRILLLGDRPDPGVTADLFGLIGRWRAHGIDVSVLNRHEGNWSRLPRLRALGAEVILGGDWAYFWGQAVSEVDLAWARIGALCARDPTQCTVGMTPREQAVTDGLLHTVHTALSQPPGEDLDAWLDLAKPILDRIADDDRTAFVRLARSFREICEKGAGCGRVEGRVVVFDEPPGKDPQAYYWIMEAAIEARGRAPVRGLRFNVPYAIASWRDQDAIELLAISHWREEDAIPIRLLYPSDVVLPGVRPEPQGDECTVRIRVSAEQAAVIIPALVAACNQEGSQ